MMGHWLDWLTRRPATGDTPDVLIAGVLAVVGFIVWPLAYWRLRGSLRWFLAYGLAWLGIIGLLRIYESLGGNDRRFLAAAVEGAFVLTYSVVGLTIIDFTQLPVMVRWGVEVLLIIAAGAGGLLILITLIERRTHGREQA